MGLETEGNQTKNELLNEDSLDELIDLIIDQDVAIVVGPELSQVNDPKFPNAPQNLYDRLFPELEDQVRKSQEWYDKWKHDGESWNFRELAVFLENDASKKRITRSIIGLEEHADLTYYQKLAAMSFDTFISVTPDSWLTKAIRNWDQAHDNVGIHEFNYHNESLNSPVRNLDVNSKKVIINLLGSINANKTGYACSNNEILDWLYTFYKDIKDFQNCNHEELKLLLEKVVGKSTLLFIGCDFPDWLFCLLCRALNFGNLRDNNFTKFIAHNSLLMNPKLYSTLEGISARIYIDHNYYKTSGVFVDSLFSAWNKRQKLEEDKNKDVFLSFSSANRSQVKKVFQYLSVDRGMKKIWFDEEKLNSGNDYHIKISKALRQVKVFVMFLSKETTDLLSNTDENKSDPYFPKEWEIARHEFDSRPEEEKLVIKLFAIDDTAMDKLQKTLPDRFQTLSIKRISVEGSGDLKALFNLINDDLANAANG